MPDFIERCDNDKESFFAVHNEPVLRHVDLDSGQDFDADPCDVFDYPSYAILFDKCRPPSSPQGAIRYLNTFCAVSRARVTVVHPHIAHIRAHMILLLALARRIDQEGAIQRFARSSNHVYDDELIVASEPDQDMAQMFVRGCCKLRSELREFIHSRMSSSLLASQWKHLVAIY
jgi:hypothetical protein